MTAPHETMAVRCLACGMRGRVSAEAFLHKLTCVKCGAVDRFEMLSRQAGSGESPTTREAAVSSAAPQPATRRGRRRRVPARGNKRPGRRRTVRAGGDMTLELSVLALGVLALVGLAAVFGGTSDAPPARPQSTPAAATLPPPPTHPRPEPAADALAARWGSDPTGGDRDRERAPAHLPADRPLPGWLQPSQPD